MWINWIAYILINIINGHCLSTYTTVTSSKTDNAIFIYPGQVNKFFSIQLVIKKIEYVLFIVSI